MPVTNFEKLELYKFPHTPTRLHDRVLKVLVLLISFVPLLAFMIAFTVRSQGQTQELCVFKFGTSGAIPCFAVAQLEFEKKTRPLDLLLGPLIDYAVHWQITCLDKPLNEEDFKMVDRSRLIGVLFAPPDEKDFKIYDYMERQFKEMKVEDQKDCFYETVYSINNLVFVEFMEIAILLGVAIYYGFHFFLPVFIKLV
jgi:hypothetical protein